MATYAVDGQKLTDIADAIRARTGNTETMSLDEMTTEINNISTITHSWDGTILTVTSDSGTSSADLKGDAFTYEDFTDLQLAALRGQPGPQGVQGVTGSSAYLTFNFKGSETVGNLPRENNQVNDAYWCTDIKIFAIWNGSDWWGVGGGDFEHAVTVEPTFLAETEPKVAVPDLDQVVENRTILFYLQNDELLDNCIPANFPAEEKAFIQSLSAAGDGDNEYWRTYELQSVKAVREQFIVRVQRLYEVRYGGYYYERYHHTSWGEWRKVYTSGSGGGHNGKKCACFGDSITWYDGKVYNWGKAVGQVAVGYESYLRSRLGMQVSNYGFSGFTAPLISDEVKKVDLSDYDYVTITSGANDTRCSTPLGAIAPIGSAFDTTTYYGAIQSAVEYIINQNNDAKIVLITPIKGWCYAGGYEPAKTEDGEITEDWANALKEIGKLYSLPVCDWYNESGLNILTRDIYINDPEPPENTLYSFHPSAALYKRMAALLVETFGKI